MTMSIGPACAARRRNEVTESKSWNLADSDSMSRMGWQVGIELAQVRDHLGDVPDTGAELPAHDGLIGPPDEHAQSLHPRPVRRRAGVVPASPNEHPHPVVASSRRELIGQAALADARLAEQQEQAPLPGRRVTEPSEKLAQLTVAADEDGNGLWLGHGATALRPYSAPSIRGPASWWEADAVHIRSALARLSVPSGCTAVRPNLTPHG